MPNGSRNYKRTAKQFNIRDRDTTEMHCSVCHSALYPREYQWGRCIECVKKLMISVKAAMK